MPLPVLDIVSTYVLGTTRKSKMRRWYKRWLFRMMIRDFRVADEGRIEKKGGEIW